MLKFQRFVRGPAAGALRQVAGLRQSAAARQDLLFTPGPLLTSPAVKAPMGVDVGSRDVALVSAVKTIREQTVALGNGGDDYECVIVQGSGTYGVESVLASWYGGPAQPGLPRRPLVLINGAYGTRAKQIIQRYRGVPEILTLEFPEDLPVDPAQVAEVLAADPTITDVYTIHSETTTGMINDVQAIGDVIRAARGGSDREIVYTIDAMSSFGAYDCDLPSLGADFLVTSANKNIQGVPGFALVLGRKDRIAQCQGKSPSLSLDLYDQMVALCSGSGQFRFTPPTHALMAFVEALKELEAEGGVAARRGRYHANLKVLTDGMTELGFASLLGEKQGCIISTFVSPKDPNWDFERFYDFLSDKGCVIYPGKLTKVDSFRIGTIGHLFPEDFEHLLTVIKGALDDLGVKDCSPIDWTPSSGPGVLTHTKV